jgi:hemoglobin-like flavoprotein
MTPAQIALVRKSYAQVVLNLEQVAALFYQRLLDLDPSIGAMFRGDPVIQRIKLGAALASLVSSLGQMNHLLPAMRALGLEQARKGIKAEHYMLVGEALIWALDHALRDNFATETRRAWIAAYDSVARTMVGAAAEDWCGAEAA